MASRKKIAMNALALTTVCLALAACWTLPAQLWRQGGYYGFAFVGDETYYAVRTQPLIAGTTASNTFNGFSDPHLVSPWFLEDSLRALISLCGLQTITFIWIWRFVFPVLLWGACWLLARFCFPDRDRPGAGPLRAVAASFTLVALYAIYDLCVAYPPLQGWLQRYPTNIEYVLSVLLAASAVAFVNVPTIKRGTALALASAAMVYLRPYAVVPWAPAVVLCACWLFWKKRMSLRCGLATVGVLLVAVAPWMAVTLWNAKSPVQAELLKRYFTETPYAVNSFWTVYIACAALLAVAAFFVEAYRRALLVPAALALAALPFVCGLFVFASELVYERFSSFYLTMLAVAVLLVVDNYLGRRERVASPAPENRALGPARLATFALAAASLAGAGVVLARDWNCDFAEYALGPFRCVRDEERFLPAYRWVRANTPPEALFILDDGCDWSGGWLPNDPKLLSDMLVQGDLFQVVARRRRVLSERLVTVQVGDRDLEALTLLQRCTFGLPVYGKAFSEAVKRFRPTYLFIRGETPLTRGLLPKFRDLSRQVYADPACQIWEITYEAKPKAPGAPPKR